MRSIGKVAVIAGLLATATGAAPSTRTELVRLDGPYSVSSVSFAGRNVLYVPQYGRPVLYSIGPAGPLEIYRAPNVPVPPRLRRSSIYDARIVQVIDSVEGSENTIAFVRRVAVRQTPKCRPGCHIPDRIESLFTEVRARVGSRAFRRIAGGPGRCPRGQFWPGWAAVTGKRVVYSGRLDGCAGRPQETRILVANPAAPRLVRAVIGRFPEPRFISTPVAAAGSFAAWTRHKGELPNRDLRDPELVVYDLARDRIRYTVKLPARLRVRGIYSLDVQSDAKVAAHIERESATCSIPRLLWSAPARHPHLRFLPDRSDSTEVELAGDRIMFVQAEGRDCPDSASNLMMISLDGSSRRVLGRYDFRARPQTSPGRSFDFDGARTAFAESVNTDPGGSNQGWTSIFVDDER